MKSSFESGILFDMPLVLGEGGGADESYVSAGECGLQNIGGVQPARSIARTDEGVNLIDEEDDIGIAFDFTDNFLEACFEFSAETRSGDDEGEIDGEDFFAGEKISRRTVFNFLREGGDEGGFSYAGVAEEEGIVFLFPSEDMDEPFEFVGTTDEGFGGHILSEIDCELIKKGSFGMRGVFFSGQADFREIEHFGKRWQMIVVQVSMDGLHGFLATDGEVVEEGFDVGIAGFDQCRDEMLRTDIRGSEFRGERECSREDFFERSGEIEHGLFREFEIGLFDVLRCEDDFSEGLLFEADVFEEDFAETALLEIEREEDMLRIDMGRAGIERDIPSLFEGFFGMEGEFFGEGKSFHIMKGI